MLHRFNMKKDSIIILIVSAFLELSHVCVWWSLWKLVFLSTETVDNSLYEIFKNSFFSKCCIPDGFETYLAICF